MTITNWAIDHRVSAFVLILILLVAGVGAYQALPREAAPDITIPYVMVTTPYIGASPNDVETLVTEPIESELEKLKDVDEIRSTSADGFSLVVIEFQTGVNIDDALQKVRERVDAAVPDLPADALAPTITEISTTDWPILTVNISGSVGLVALRNAAEQLQERLERIPGVLEVRLVGGIEREIRVEADPDLLEFYSVSMRDLIVAIQSQNLNMPAGTMDLGEIRYSVRVPGELERIADIEDLILRVEDGHPIYLSDVARVVDGYEEQTTYSRITGRPSVSLSVIRRSGENLLGIADQVKQITEQYERESAAQRLTFTFLGDQSKMVKDTVADLENSMITGLILVLLVLLFFMGGVRNALFVAVAIPLVMFTSFLVLWALGITLNMVVLFALILALGMIVDNAIVTTENIYRHTAMGKSRIQAAKDAIAEVGWPVIASAATTMAAFVPLLFWPGISGEFMSYLPKTVLVVLGVSLFVALVLNPVVCSRFMRVRPQDTGQSALVDEMEALPNNVLYRLYRRALTFSLGHRWVVVVLLVAVFAGTFFLFSRFNAGVEFFPRTTPDQIYLGIRLPEGSSLEATDRVARQVERILADEENIKHYVSDVGTSGSFRNTQSSTHLARITVDFLDQEDRVESPYDTIERIREATRHIPGASVDIESQQMGPPSGQPVNVEIVGSDYDVLGQLSRDILDRIQRVPGIMNLQADFDSGRSEVSVRVDREAASLLSISTSDVAFTVRAAVHGIEASVFRQDDEEIDVIVGLAEEYRTAVEDIERLTIPAREGARIPITEVADIRVGQGFSAIQHIDTERVITVSADVIPGFNENAVLAQVQDRIDAQVPLPAGYEIRYTGASEAQAESAGFLSRSLMAALFLVALVLVAQFNNISQPLIIMGAVLFSMIGVLLTLVIRQFPFSIVMTGVAIISLAGVVVNNAIVLLDYINKERAKGYAVKEAVIRAGLVRMRPVLLTALTTCLSLTAMVFGVALDARTFRLIAGSGSAEFWGPMANAVAGGILLATILTLLVVPVMYSANQSLLGLFRRKGADRYQPALATASSGGPPPASGQAAGAPATVDTET
ncbi:MAG: efflux RND transporter permease subunit [Bradymonadales bacterium]|nr:efflux RND transporter permease subunit [Bradymonadales bacterium]